MQEVLLPGQNSVIQPVQCRTLYQTAKERHPMQYWQGVVDKICAAALWVLVWCICFIANIRALKNYLFCLSAQSIYKSPKNKIVRDMLCGFNSSDRKSTLSIVFLIQINPLYLAAWMTFATREPLLMNWVSFHLPDKFFIFISWLLEYLLTAVASKPQSKNPRLVKYRAENGLVLKQTDGNLIVESNLVLGLSQQDINLQSRGTNGHFKVS